MMMLLMDMETIVCSTAMVFWWGWEQMILCITIYTDGHK